MTALHDRDHVVLEAGCGKIPQTTPPTGVFLRCPERGIAPRTLQTSPELASTMKGSWHSCEVIGTKSQELEARDHLLQLACHNAGQVGVSHEALVGHACLVVHLWVEDGHELSHSCGHWLNSTTRGPLCHPLPQYSIGGGLGRSLRTRLPQLSWVS